MIYVTQCEWFECDRCNRFGAGKTSIKLVANQCLFENKAILCIIYLISIDTFKFIENYCNLMRGKKLSCSSLKTFSQYRVQSLNILWTWLWRINYFVSCSFIGSLQSTINIITISNNMEKNRIEWNKTKQRKNAIKWNWLKCKNLCNTSHSLQINEHWK